VVSMSGATRCDTFKFSTFRFVTSNVVINASSATKFNVVKFVLRIFNVVKFVKFTFSATSIPNVVRLVTTIDVTFMSGAMIFRAIKLFVLTVDKFNKSLYTVVGVVILHTLKNLFNKKNMMSLSGVDDVI
jgi:hypothetical protein